MAKHRTEQVYDDEMSPLVAKLVEISQREKIPLIVSAGMLGPDGENMTCDTMLIFGRSIGEPMAGIENRFGLSHNIIRGHAGFDTAEALMITRHHAPPTPKGEA